MKGVGPRDEEEVKPRDVVMDWTRECERGRKTPGSPAWPARWMVAIPEMGQQFCV